MSESPYPGDLERALMDFVGDDQFLDRDRLLLVIPPGSRVTFDQERLGVTGALTRDGITVLAIRPEALSALAPNPNLPPPSGIPPVTIPHGNLPRLPRIFRRPPLWRR